MTKLDRPKRNKRATSAKRAKPAAAPEMEQKQIFSDTEVCAAAFRVLVEQIAHFDKQVSDINKRKTRLWKKFKSEHGRSLRAAKSVVAITRMEGAAQETYMADHAELMQAAGLAPGRSVTRRAVERAAKAANGGGNSGSRSGAGSLPTTAAAVSQAAREDFAAGKTLADNPYHTSAPAHATWESAFLAAVDEAPASRERALGTAPGRDRPLLQ
jgi:hypothetical protein